MNNILSYLDYFNSINEEKTTEKEEKGWGLRKWLNRRAKGRVKAALQEEIEMSKSIMDGIKLGLESLDDDFSNIRKALDKEGNKDKGEKQKQLDEIYKIIETSRKSTWDINELIDEGEIDYSGFTGNIAYANFRYFGVMLFPITNMILMKKAYNYFFSNVRNTIRKALVMLQVNFDQFENLIITKSFQSSGYIQEMDTNAKISEFYKDLELKLFDKKHGMMKGKRGSEYAEKQMKLAKQQIDEIRKHDSILQKQGNAFDCLDRYDNTYTKSLETLRQYTQDDVQKHLDGIKTSMQKIAGNDVDMTAYVELLLAAADEHAFKVSSSIYNKFAKMTEVFSLPNQKKLIDLIQASTKEQVDEAERERKKKLEAEEFKDTEKEHNELEAEGKKIFESSGDATVGDADDEGVFKKIEGADNWTFDRYNELSDDDKETMFTWFKLHPEVLDKCDETLQIAIPKSIGDGYFDYIDILADMVKPTLVEESAEFVKSFDDYFVIEESKKTDEIESDVKEKLKNVDTIEGVNNAVFPNFQKYTKISVTRINAAIDYYSSKLIDNPDDKKSQKIKDYLNTILDRVKYCLDNRNSGDKDKKHKVTIGNKTLTTKEVRDAVTDPNQLDYDDHNAEDNESKIDTKESDKKDDKKSDKNFYISIVKSENHMDIMKKSFSGKMKGVAKTALYKIGEDVIDSKSFSESSDIIVDKINEAIKRGVDKKVKISKSTYDILLESIKKMTDEKDKYDYRIFRKKKGEIKEQSTETNKEKSED